MKRFFFILTTLMASATSLGDTSLPKVETLCRLWLQDRQYLEENLETILRGELALEELARLAPAPSEERCEQTFAFEVEKADFLLAGLKANPQMDAQVSKSEIAFGMPVVNQMQREGASADSLILLEMVSSLPLLPPQRFVEVHFQQNPESGQGTGDSAMRQDFPSLWRELVQALRNKLKNSSRSLKLSETSPAP